MSSESEPPLKRYKIMKDVDTITLFDYINESIDNINKSTTNLTPVIGEHFTEPIPCTEVYTAVIKNLKDISKAILSLNKKYSLTELQHLKRVRKNEIVIAAVKTIEPKTIEAFVDEDLKDLADIFDDYKVVKVPALPPKLKWQFEECNKLWPCNFHPNKYNELLFSGAFYDNKELCVHRMFMTVAFEVLRLKLEDKLHNDYAVDKLSEYGVTVVVDPTIQSIVAVGVDNRNEHPLQHASMLAIDNVARTQNGGSWSVHDDMSTEAALRGIAEDLRVKLKETIPNLTLGAKPFKSKRQGENQSGPYLCTGYDVYTLNEPCAMCAMALVHARAKRVFFCRENGTDGALKTKAKLQTIGSLNHHFEVFTGFL